MDHVQIGLITNNDPQVVLVVSSDNSPEQVQLGMTAGQARQIAVTLLQYADQLEPPA